MTSGRHPAIYWDSPVSGQKETYTYVQLKEEVEVLAGVLSEAGLKKGDNVVVYMPMIPQALIGLLAVTRLGASHTVVFGGFSSASLAQRIEASQPRMVLTASCGIEGNKGATSYQPLVRDAIEKSSWKPERTLIWQRQTLRWDPVKLEIGEMHWNKLVRSAQKRGVRAGCVPVRSDDPVYIIYTSGTTGQPKGVVRETAGHLVGLNLSIRYMFGLRGPGDVMFCASVRHCHLFYYACFHVECQCSLQSALGYWVGSRAFLHLIRTTTRGRCNSFIRRQTDRNA